jgi:hypothetical protein
MFTIREYTETDRHEVISLWQNAFKNDPPWNDPAEIINRKQLVQRELFLVGLQQERVIAKLSQN